MEEDNIFEEQDYELGTDDNPEDFFLENDLQILKVFSEETIVYILIEDGSYKTIQCSGINEAKNLYLAITNR